MCAKKSPRCSADFEFYYLRLLYFSRSLYRSRRSNFLCSSVRLCVLAAAFFSGSGLTPISLPRAEPLFSLPFFLRAVSVTNAAASSSAITLKTTAVTVPAPDLCIVLPLSLPRRSAGDGVSVGMGPGISTGPTSAGCLVGRGVGSADGRAEGDTDGAGAAVLVGRIVFFGVTAGRGVAVRGVDAGRAVTVGRIVAVPEFV